MNAHRSVVFALGVGRVAAVLLLCGSASGQAKDEFIIVDGARPVAAAVHELIKRHPVVITYEDPRYAYAGDLKDVTDQIRNPLAPPRTDGHRALVPVGGPIQVRYAVSSATNTPVDLAETLESIVQAKAALPAGGRFRVERSGNVFHVVPSQVRDASGRWVQHTSVLDVAITLKTGELTGFEMVSAILNEISARNGVKLGIGAIPINSLMRYRGVVEANNEPARALLLRTLQGISERFTWSLSYDPVGKMYAFSIVAASAKPTVEIRVEPALPRPGDPTPAGPPFGR